MNFWTTMSYLTHWGRVTHICVGKLTIIGSDNGLTPGRRQAIVWTNAGILLIWPLGTNFSEILIAIETFSFKKMHFKLSSGKWRPSCLGLNVLRKLCPSSKVTEFCRIISIVVLFVVSITFCVMQVWQPYFLKDNCNCLWYQLDINWLYIQTQLSILSWKDSLKIN